MRALLLLLCLGAAAPALAIPRAKLARVKPIAPELFAAIEAADTMRVRRALKRGADPNAPFLSSSPLERAFRANGEIAVPVVAALLDGGAQLDEGTLYAALQHGDERVFALLFKRGLSVHRRVPNWDEGQDETRMVSLFEGALDGMARPSFLRFLLARGADGGEAELKAAANTRNRDAIGILLDAGAKPKATDSFLLPVAAGKGDAKLLERLLKSGVLPSSVRGEDEESPLHLACDADETARDERPAPLAARLKCVQLLLDAGAKVNERYWQGCTPLMLAARGSVQAPLVKLLLQRGADPNARDASGQSAAFYAIPTRLLSAKQVEAAFDPFQEGLEDAKRIATAPENLDTLRLLRDAGADLKSPATVDYGPLPPNWKTLRRYQVPQQSSLLTPLHLAATADRVPTIQFLLAAGAAVNAADADGQTPLHFAAKSGAPHAVVALLNAGADIEARDKHGQTALLMACGGDARGFVDYGLFTLNIGSPGSVAAARALLDGGANIGAANDNGDTALHLAATGGRAEVAKLLLDYGANPDTPDKRGQTPRSLASTPYRLRFRGQSNPPSAYERRQDERIERDFVAPLNAGRRKISASLSAKTSP